jgi:selenide,water dikinase
MTRMVLAGVGHANLEVLRRLGARPGRTAGADERQVPEASLDLTVISPEPWHCYSGMVPGYLRGLYRFEEIAVELAPLVGRAGGSLLLGQVEGLDPRRRVVKVSAAAAGESAGREVPYDLVAFAVGSDAAGAAAATAQAGDAVLSCKPIGRVVELRRRLDALAEAGQPAATVVVVGGGAAGVEIALAIAGRLSTASPASRVILIEAGPAILAGSSPRFRRRAEQVLARHGVELRTGTGVTGVLPGDGARLLLTAGDRQSEASEIACSLAVWVTSAVGWPFFRDAGLPLDGRGFLLIDAGLRSVADPRVFAAGDCGTLAAFPGTAKAGVYAVREGPVLFRSLRAALAGGRPPRYRPQRGFLVILNTGDGRALLAYKRFVSYSRWAFRLKDWIDRRFLARYGGRR